MASGSSYLCRSCGQTHDGLPFSYGFDAPALWTEELATDESSVLEEEICIVHGQHFFVRGRIVIPVTDADADFDWGVWVSLSRASFLRTHELWDSPGREAEPAYFGWLSSDIPIYQPSTLSLRTHVHTQTIGQRPIVQLEDTDHPLAVEQRRGMTLSRVQQIAEDLLHPSSGL